MLTVQKLALEMELSLNYFKVLRPWVANTSEWCLQRKCMDALVGLFKWLRKYTGSVHLHNNFSSLSFFNSISVVFS